MTGNPYDDPAEEWVDMPGSEFTASITQARTAERERIRRALDERAAKLRAAGREDVAEEFSRFADSLGEMT